MKKHQKAELTNSLDKREGKMKHVVSFMKECKHQIYYLATTRLEESEYIHSSMLVFINEVYDKKSF